MTQTNTDKTVKINSKAHYKGFEKAFGALPHDHISGVRKELMGNLGWSISLFYYKKRGDTPIRENEVPIIESVFEGFGLNAWTGEKI